MNDNWSKPSVSLSALEEARKRKAAAMDVAMRLEALNKAKQEQEAAFEEATRARQPVQPGGQEAGAKKSSPGSRGLGPSGRWICDVPQFTR